MLRQLLRPVVRNVSQRGTRSYHDVTHYKPATMEEMPIPQGPWQQQYDAKQKIYNKQLIAGILYTIGTFTYIFATNAIFWNWSPPTPKDEKK